MYRETSVGVFQMSLLACVTLRLRSKHGRSGRWHLALGWIHLALKCSIIFTSHMLWGAQMDLFILLCILTFSFNLMQMVWQCRSIDVRAPKYPVQGWLTLHKLPIYLSSPPPFPASSPSPLFSASSFPPSFTVLGTEHRA